MSNPTTTTSSLPPPPQKIRFSGMHIIDSNDNNKIEKEVGVPDISSLSIFNDNATSSESSDGGFMFSTSS
jgi:hypothetical protein